MRRVYLPGGGWILLAACAIPFFVSMAKPIAKRIGKGMKTMGEKLMDATDEPGPVPEPGKQAKPRKPASKPRARTAKKRPTAAKPTES